MKKIVLIVVDAGIVLFSLTQFVALGWVNANPPAVQEIQCDSPEAHLPAQPACFGRHSNETVWPQHIRIAPSSWLVVKAVVEGRGFTRAGVT